MGERKVVGRNIAIVLGVVCVVLAAGLIGAVANYTSVISSLNSQITEKDHEISSLNSQIASLNSQIQMLANERIRLQSWLDGNKTLLSQLQAWLDGNKTVLQEQINQLQKWLSDNITYYKSEINSLYIQILNLRETIANLQNQINSLKAPKLITVDLKANDNRPWLGTPYLYVYGYVCNVGRYPAHNSRIHVVAYQSGGVIAIDTYINLGTIDGESWKSVDARVYYSGSALVSWTLTLEWAS